MDDKTRALVIEEINGLTPEQVEEARALDMVCLYAVVRLAIGASFTDDLLPVLLMRQLERRWKDRSLSHDHEVCFHAMGICFSRWTQAMMEADKANVSQQIEELLRDL